MVLETKAWLAHKYSARKDQPLVPDELTPHSSVDLYISCRAMYRYAVDCTISVAYKCNADCAKICWAMYKCASVYQWESVHLPPGGAATVG